MEARIVAEPAGSEPRRDSMWRFPSTLGQGMCTKVWGDVHTNFSRSDLKMVQWIPLEANPEVGEGLFRSQVRSAHAVPPHPTGP